MHTTPDASCTIKNEKCITHNTQHSWTYESCHTVRSINYGIVNYELCIISALILLYLLKECAYLTIPLHEPVVGIFKLSLEALVKYA